MPIIFTSIQGIKSGELTVTLAIVIDLKTGAAKCDSGHVSMQLFNMYFYAPSQVIMPEEQAIASL